jgi:hypothetical protein
MKKAVGIAVLSACLSFVAGIAVADRVRDWHDLEAVHVHVQEAMKELDHARAANHYDTRRQSGGASAGSRARTA